MGIECWGGRVSREGGGKQNSPVMLSAAKHLAVHRGRPFATLRVTRWGSEWQGARERPFAALRVTRDHCHAEHIRYAQCKLREASRRPPCEALRCAQGDKGGGQRGRPIGINLSTNPGYRRGEG